MCRRVKTKIYDLKPKISTRQLEKEPLHMQYATYSFPKIITSQIWKQCEICFVLRIEYFTRLTQSLCMELIVENNSSAIQSIE